MTRQLEATFEVKSWDEAPVDAMARRFTRASVTKTFHGDVEGSSLIEYLMAYADEEHAAFVGIERIDGTIQGRSGSLVLRHVGTFEEGAATATVTVVERTGTEELAGVSGEGDFLADPGGSLALDLSFG